MSDNTNIDFYNKNAIELNEMYSSKPFDCIHQSWKHMLKRVPLKSYVLDVGAGNGRDALALSNMGYDVTAVEPADKLSQFLRSNTQSKANNHIEWLSDSLPSINSVKELNKQYSVILLSAVWMHLNKEEQEESIKNLSQILYSNGIIVITIRNGSFKDGRTTSNPTVNELDALIHKYGLKNIHTSHSNDELNRSDVSWTTVVISHKDR